MTEPRPLSMLQRTILKYVVVSRSCDVVTFCLSYLPFYLRLWIHRYLRRSVSTSTRRDVPIQLHHRSLFEVTGVDGPGFLQGLITADVLNPTRLVQYSMFLNHQGRVLYDIIIYHVGRGRLWVESDKSATNDIIQHLKRYILRSKVDIKPLSNTTVYALLPSNQEDITTQSILRITDPRTSQLGDRVLSQTPLSSDTSAIKDYHIHRMKCGVAESTGELPPGQCLPFEVNLDFMDGVSFDKGCYLGQELTSRTHHTGVIRKRLVPLTLENRSSSSVSWGTRVTLSSGKTVGKILGCYDNHAIGILRLPDLKDGEPLYVDTDSERLVINWFKPNWWPQQ